MVEPLDEVAAKRQKTMIQYFRESAVRFRETKQAHQVALEARVWELEEENEFLLKEIAEMREETQELMESVMIDEAEGSTVSSGSSLDVYGGGGTGAKGMVAPLDHKDAAALKEKERRIKNLESAARLREKKDAFFAALQARVAELENENTLLLLEIEYFEGHMG